MLLFSFLAFHSPSTKTFSITETHETTHSARIDGWIAWGTAATGQGTFNSTPRTWTGTSDGSTVKSTRT
jgi:hypothetical protein